MVVDDRDGWAVLNDVTLKKTEPSPAGSELSVVIALVTCEKQEVRIVSPNVGDDGFTVTAVAT